MVKTALKDTYLGVTTPTALQNEVSTWQKMYYDKENRVMVKHSVNKFYIRFLFKMYALLQDVVLPLDITTNFLNRLSPNAR